MVFLSPWITSDLKQVQIDQPLTTSQISQFIKGIEGVESVGKVSFEPNTELNPLQLMVTVSEHKITPTKRS